MDMHNMWIYSNEKGQITMELNQAININYKYWQTCLSKQEWWRKYDHDEVLQIVLLAVLEKPKVANEVLQKDGTNGLTKYILAACRNQLHSINSKFHYLYIKPQLDLGDMRPIDDLLEEVIEPDDMIDMDKQDYISIIRYEMNQIPITKMNRDSKSLFIKYYFIYKNLRILGEEENCNMYLAWHKINEFKQILLQRLKDKGYPVKLKINKNYI